jgi:hypothetical protein
MNQTIVKKPLLNQTIDKPDQKKLKMVRFVWSQFILFYIHLIFLLSFRKPDYIENLA